MFHANEIQIIFIFPMKTLVSFRSVSYRKVAKLHKFMQNVQAAMLIINIGRFFLQFAFLVSLQEQRARHKKTGIEVISAGV